MAGRRSLPFEQTVAVVQSPSGIDVCHKFVLTGKRPYKLDLQVAAGLTNAEGMFLAEAVGQLNALLEVAIPDIAMRVLVVLILLECPRLTHGTRCVLGEVVCGEN